jgi:hypothetical protein
MQHTNTPSLMRREAFLRHIAPIAFLDPGKKQE